MKLSFFSVRQPRRFNYQPVFYDEAKEKRIERERRVREELGLPPVEGSENIKPADRLRGKFTAARTTKSVEFARKTERTSNIRILVIAAILLMLIYVMFGSGLERFFGVFGI